MCSNIVLHPSLSPLNNILTGMDLSLLLVNNGENGLMFKNYMDSESGDELLNQNHGIYEIF